MSKGPNRNLTVNGFSNTRVNLYTRLRISAGSLRNGKKPRLGSSESSSLGSKSQTVDGSERLDGAGPGKVQGSGPSKTLPSCPPPKCCAGLESSERWSGLVERGGGLWEVAEGRLPRSMAFCCRWLSAVSGFSAVADFLDKVWSICTALPSSSYQVLVCNGSVIR